MDQLTLFAFFLALIWGFVWAMLLQFTDWGRFLARRRTWLTVVIGVGVDLGLALLCVPITWWWRVVAIVALSSIGIITRSLSNEYSETMELVNDHKNQIAEQNDLES